MEVFIKKFVKFYEKKQLRETASTDYLYDLNFLGYI